MAGDSAPLGKLQLTRHDGRRMYQRPLPDIRDDEERISTAREALKCGFWSMLKDAFPERWTEWPEASDMKLLFEDIEKATGYVFEEVSFASSSTRLFHAFRAKNFSTSPEEYAGPVVAWHGSSKAGVWGISERGFDEKRLRPGAFGNGVYVSPDAFVALLYAEPCKDGKLCVLFGNAHLGDLARIPVGSRGQTDFGRHADGADVLTLRNSAASYFCMKCENANDGQLLGDGVFDRHKPAAERLRAVPHVLPPGRVGEVQAERPGDRRAQDAPAAFRRLAIAGHRMRYGPRACAGRSASPGRPHEQAAPAHARGAGPAKTPECDTE